MALQNLPLVGITMGDPAGIGPEIVARSLADEAVGRVCRPLVIGDGRIMAEAVKLQPAPLQIRSIETSDAARFAPGIINVLDLRNIAPGDYEQGTINASCGRAFVDYIRCAARMAISGEIDAIASAPTNKEAMHAAGEYYPGQTEIFAEECGVKQPFTILTGGRMRVFLLSSHVSLRQAIDLVRQERVESVIRQAQAALQELWGVERPRIAIAGLNPHAGDGGLFGREEIEEVIPVVERLRAEGFSLEGPGPADSVYHAADRGEYDALVGMYHDQGVIPLKRYGYVTVIAGIPIIRTTAGHGTAYDIAWKGRGIAAVMQRAIQLAAELAELRKSHFHNDTVAGA